MRRWVALFVASFASNAAAIELRATDVNGAPAARVSIERTPPAAPPSDDPDAVQFLVVGAAGELPSSLAIASFGKADVPGEDAPIDTLDHVALSAAPCPTGTPAERVCAVTPQIRAAMDEVDRQHPLVRDRSIRAELGGTLVATSKGGASLALAVGAPRSLGSETLSARLRLRLVRLDPGGAPPVGADDADAIDRARGEVARAAMVWGQCGVDFGELDALDVQVVDPPPPHLLAIGCDAAAPASGGIIRFDVDGAPVEVKVAKGTSPRGAARLVAAAIRKKGFEATIFDGSPGLASTYGPSDISVRRKNGELAILAASFEPASDGSVIRAGHASTDATLDVCVGSAAMPDGFDHFTDANAVQGSLEERTLLRAFDDGDPRTIDVVVVPSFGGPSRIGESFIYADGGSIRNFVIEDRAGFRADRASFTLAHELGHVLLGEPGHPDDYDVDTPTLLMDADAVNATAFGPRRITLSECTRALVQSGPSSPVGFLAPASGSGAKNAKKMPPR